MQHTSTHSTRLVALTSSDTTKRTKCTQQTTAAAVPLPLPAHALIKIEDGSVNAHHSNHHHQPTTSTLFEQEKSIQTASIATAVQTPTEINGQLFYQHPGLIQIAPQPPIAHQSTATTTLSSIMDAGHHTSPPPLQLTATTTHSTGGCISDTQLSLVPSVTCPPEVQDANIQTSPIMSEDDNSTGVADTQITTEYEEESQESPTAAATSISDKPIIENEPEITREETKEHRESVPDTSVTSSSLIVIKQQIESPDTSINEAKCNEAEITRDSVHQEQKEPVDLSGLQLLSHSIDVFQKKIIKQEPQVRRIKFYSIFFITHFWTCCKNCLF